MATIDEEMEQDRGGGVMGPFVSINEPRNLDRTEWDSDDDDVDKSPLASPKTPERAPTPTTPDWYRRELAMAENDATENTSERDDDHSDDGTPIAQLTQSKKQNVDFAADGTRSAAAAASPPKTQRTHALPVPPTQHNAMIEESDDGDYEEPQLAAAALLHSTAFIAVFGPRVPPSEPRSAIT
eukprot:3826773-Rhodomonas_salina.1